jgi:hypothetical protein
MPFSDPTFEARLNKISGVQGPNKPIVSSGYSNPAFEKRLQQIVQSPKPQTSQVSQPVQISPNQTFISKAKQTTTNFIDSAFKTVKSIAKPVTKQVSKILDKPVPKKIALAYAKLSPNEQGREFERKIKSGEVKSISDVFAIPRNVTGQQAATMIEEGLNSLFFALPATSSLKGATKTFGDFVKSGLIGGGILAGTQAGITKLKGEKQDVKGLAESFAIGTAFGFATPKQFPKKGKKITITPDEAINKVINTDLENTPVGKKIIKTSFEAKAKDTKIEITYDEISKLKTQSGVGVKVELETIKAEGNYTRVISDRELKTLNETGKLPANKEGYVNVINPGEKSLKVGENKTHVVTFKPEVKGLIESEAKGQSVIKGEIPKTYVQSIKENVIKPKTEKKPQSRVFERLQQEHPEQLKGELPYDRAVLKKEFDEAAGRIVKDKQKAYELAMGREQGTTEIKSVTTSIELAEQALKEGKNELYEKLTRNRSIAQTRRGQAVVAEKGSVIDNSVSRYVKELVSSRLETLGKKYLSGLKEGDSIKKRAVEVLDGKVEQLETKIAKGKLDVKTALKLLDELACLT